MGDLQYLNVEVQYPPGACIIGLDHLNAVRTNRGPLNGHQ